MPVSDQEIIKITEETVRSSFFAYFCCRKEPDTKHILLSKLFPEESAIRSAIGGLETSLGTTLWEKIATRIAMENGFEILNPKSDFLQPKKMPTSVTNLIAEYKNLREVENANIPMDDYLKYLYELIDQISPKELPHEFKKLTKGSGVDIFLRKDGVEYAFDLKTVQINAGSGTKFNETLMKWYAARCLHIKHLNLNFKLKAHIVIPYDPHVSSNWWNEFGERAYPLDKNDVLLGNEFWNFLSGQNNTLEVITKAFQNLVEDNFQASYREFLYGSDIKKSIELIKEVALISMIDDKFPNSITDNCQWQCAKCNMKFKKSIQAIVNRKKCPKCEEFFMK